MPPWYRYQLKEYEQYDIIINIYYITKKKL
jgi:hypothetical protein